MSQDLKESLESNQSEMTWVTYSKDFCGNLISGKSFFIQ